MTVGSRYVVFASDFDAPIAVWSKASLPREELPQRLPEQLPGSNVNGYPEAWAIDGSNIAFDKPASSAWALDFRYSKPLALSDSEPTNYILTNYPDVYLFGALVELHAYAFDDANAAKYEARFRSALDDAENAEHANRSGAVLTRLTCPVPRASHQSGILMPTLTEANPSRCKCQRASRGPSRQLDRRRSVRAVLAAVRCKPQQPLQQRQRLAPTRSRGR